MEAQPISTEKPEEIAIDGSNMDSVANSLLQTIQEDTTDNEVTPEEETNEDLEEVSVEEDETEELEDSYDDDSEGIEAEAEEDNYQELFIVKVDGQEQQVTLDQLKQSYSGQAYIQKGMQDAANQKKEVEQLHQQLQQEREKIVRLSEQLNNGNALARPTPPSQDLLKRDPIGYVEAKAKYDIQLEEFNKQQSELDKIKNQQQSEYIKLREQRAQESAEFLRKQVPEFNDAEKAKKLTGDMMEYASYRGYSNDEINNIVEARDLLVLLDATKYRQLQKSKQQANNKAKNARPVVKAGAKKSQKSQSQKQREQAISRMRQTGNPEDVASYLIV
jgi:hypothetical protein